MKLIKDSGNGALKLSRQLISAAKKYWIIRKLFLGTVILMTATIVVALSLGLFSYFYTKDLRDQNGNPINWQKIGQGNNIGTSYVLASDDSVIGGFFYENRDPIKREDIPESIINGLTSAEDKRFYSKIQFGIDPLATARALVIQIGYKIGFRYGQKGGASGLPQQTARTIYAQEVPEFRNRDQTLYRKWIEMRFAMQIIRHHSKDQIITALLNNIYFGHGANGIAEAYRVYFGKDIRKNQPTLQEVAILVSLNKSASLFCPLFHEPLMPEIKLGATEEEINEIHRQHENLVDKEKARTIRARERYNWVLLRMKEEGFISETEYKNFFFSNEDLRRLTIINYSPLKQQDSEFDYGNRMSKEFLLSLGYSDDTITHYGKFRIKTTLDPNIQSIVSAELAKQINDINQEITDPSKKINGAAVVIENSTGQIKAVSGGSSFMESQFNRAMARRSPGSAFKPFTYAAAFEYSGKTFNDTICNCPFSMRGGNGKLWSPQNFKEDNPVPRGRIPLPVGLIRSNNLATLDLARTVGPDNIVSLAHDMGVWGQNGILRDTYGALIFKMPGIKYDDHGLENKLPTAIGASDVNLIELVSAYGVFARRGSYKAPVLIKELVNQDGKVLYRSPQGTVTRQVLSWETSDKITILMRAVTKVGTAKISMRNIAQQIACKTGTSNFDDLSMVCFTPEYTIGIRFGTDLPSEIELPIYMKKMSGNSKQNVSGGWVAGPVLRRIVDRIYENRVKVGFELTVETGLEQLLASYPERYK